MEEDIKEKRGQNIVKPKKKYLKIFLIIFLLIWFLSSIYSKFMPLPEGTSLAGKVYNVSEEQIDILYDLNYLKENNTIIEQEIFKNVFSIVDNAETFIVIDMFLFNSDYSSKGRFINLTEVLKDKLLEKKKQNPSIDITFITDEINNFYGSYTSDEIQELRDSGINVIITDLTKLRDVNLIYAGFWRAYIQWFGTKGEGWIKHPLGNEKNNITLRSFLKVMNTKANHRKLIIADNNETIVSLVTSANPHDASSLHSNIGIKLDSLIWKDLLDSEKAVAKFSGSKISLNSEDLLSKAKPEEGDIQIQLLTERKIRDSMIKEIDLTKEGESIEMVMFYLSDRRIIKALLAAAERGVNISLILDPNKDAFAREKNGIPNRQVAYELITKSKGKIQIRWFDTHGEQLHAKLVIIRREGRTIIFLGSANLTKRNIGDFNLETDVKVNSPNSRMPAIEVNNLFERLWANQDGIYTADFSKYEDSSKTKYLLYRFQEATGFSSF